MENRFGCSTCALKSEAAKMLKEDELQELSKHCCEVEFEKNKLIIGQNTLSSHVLYLKRGLVKIHVEHAGKERITQIKKGTSYLCLPDSFTKTPSQFSITSLLPSTVCFIDAEAFRSFIFMNGEFAYRVIQDISKNYLSNLFHTLTLSEKHSMGKVAEALLYFSQDIFASSTFELPISRQDFSGLIGISRESVSRILSGFHQSSVLEVNERSITINDESTLLKIRDKG